MRRTWPPVRPGASIPRNSLKQVPPPLPLPLPFPSLSLPSLPLPLEVGLLIAARWSGERFSSPSGSGLSEPGRQTVFGEFQVKNLASSSNE